ncbi:MOSC domain-containing protein [Mucilaginibacter sp. Bleaf8]|uniref:MOSC domain-containing protein n=1 Tax=Mucilaginibacter sp. Bleaf8 TaxID=2834430 RepID=UPI001BCBB28E|nr:MOSC N-terminal beta barrel domain-containing protein [Mucilaginibacter sp. Bleaf8]MBS7565175.1 MOSC domain-containing protein [Mucilaginibacter sp. Bleaf8]
MLNISQLFIYPVKSLGGIAVNQAWVTSRGLEHDRRWMLVDADNKFLSQRSVPQLAHFKLALLPDGIEVHHQQNKQRFIIPFQPQTSEYAQVHIWDDVCTAQFASADADEWFTACTGIDCRLVYMPDDTHRQVDLRYAAPGQVTSFSDAYPILIVSQESLDDLNSRLTEKLPMNRFRPNIVFTGGDAYMEDRLKEFTINSIRFQGVKLCARCVMIGVNQDNAATGTEPLKTLATYRKRNNKIYFGQNLVYQGSGPLQIGDKLSVEVWAEDQSFNPIASV